MTAASYLFKPFARLRKPEIERLGGFFAGSDVLIRGLDKRAWGSYRGGCLPYFGAVLAVGLWFGWEAMGLIRPVGTGLAMSAAVLASTAIFRNAVASRRSRVLIAREEGWVGLAWTASEFCFRSLDLNVLAPWSSVTKVEYLPDEEGGLLGDTLWVHLEQGDKVLIEPYDGSFGGRPVAAWAEDIERAWAEGR